jgi:hypothetical protein
LFVDPWTALADPTRRTIFELVATRPRPVGALAEELPWDINPYWQIEADLDKTSEVEVRFIAESPNRTRVELEHRNLDRHGEDWEGMREGVRGDQGWPLCLSRFEAVAVKEHR